MRKTASVNLALIQIQNVVNSNKSDAKTLRKTLSRDFTTKNETRLTIFENLNESSKRVQENEQF